MPLTHREPRGKPTEIIEEIEKFYSNNKICIKHFIHRSYEAESTRWSSAVLKGENVIDNYNSLTKLITKNSLDAM